MSVNPRTAIVCAILNELGVALSVDNKPDRIAIQKAIYLAQVKGPDLGFRFQWYLNGPYSPELADAYYRADEERSVYDKFTAAGRLAERLAPAKEVIKANPPGIPPADWLEAVGSLDFMMRVMGRDEQTSMKRCRDLKPHLASHFEQALQVLRAKGFVPSAEVPEVHQ